VDKYRLCAAALVAAVYIGYASRCGLFAKPKFTAHKGAQLKKRILTSDQGVCEIQTGGMHRCFAGLNQPPNTAPEPKGVFEMRSN
jgi:hypothetical protein